MSKRKRHTELYDYMRTLMLAELHMSYTYVWSARRDDLLKKLEKKGWIEPHVILVSRLRSGVGKTNTVYRTTKKGRRAIYRLDRVAEPEMRSHQFTNPRWGYFRTSHMLWARSIELAELAKMSKKAKHLRSRKLGKHK